MKLAAIQHRPRENAKLDAQALVDASVAAAQQGAEVVVLPDVASLQEDGRAAQFLLSALANDLPAFPIMTSVDRALRGVASVVALPERLVAPGSRFDKASIITGDACIDASELARVAEWRPAIAVLHPRSETDLQAEAMIEFAIALSDSLAGVVVVAECAGAEPLSPGHGGSAIVVLGSVMAEALFDDDVLLADVTLPFPQPLPREPLPPVPPLLQQRFLHHTGQVAIEHGPDVS
jgi:predicted amidohydrolase